MENLTNLGAWVEGECESHDLIFRLAEEITTAVIPKHPITGVEETNKWEQEFSSKGDMWVTYTQTSPTTQGTYRHTDGKDYPVYRVTEPTVSNAEIIDGELTLLNIVSKTKTKPSATGKFKFSSITYIDELGEEVTEGLVGRPICFIPQDGKFIGYLLKQGRVTTTGDFEYNTEWGDFKIVTELPSHWNTHYSGSTITLPCGYSYNTTYSEYTTMSFNIAPRLSYNQLTYTANKTHVSRPAVLLKAIPNTPAGISPEEMYVLLEQPSTDYNHITVMYGKGCKITPAEGDPKLTYDGACDPLTVGYERVPTVIDQSKAHEIYTEMSNVNLADVFKPYEVSWELDYDGITELKSPKSFFYHGRTSTVTWLVNKKRRPDYLVNYYLSITNDRVMIVIEGDPSPGIADYYRSFGYIGKTIPFNDTDHKGNFGLTVGMGDLNKSMTGFEKNDISEETNPEYAGWGEYTSNGMYSMSMFDTRSKVKFQAYYPAFLTQLPNYSNVGTIPSHLSRLVLDKSGYQASVWTGKYHASPIYLVHQAEGYRGQLDGVVAIADHNLINLDELLVDTEIPKDEGQPELGTYTEVYKFFSLKSPINLFKHSPSPDRITVAIIKDIV